ncbi:MAG: hypothetical protein HC767_04065, partial [Akkermansiaceae bacterium]|nr:hypothetical protein [Akkermansiaceae bacterium]
MKAMRWHREEPSTTRVPKQRGLQYGNGVLPATYPYSEAQAVPGAPFHDHTAQNCQREHFKEWKQHENRGNPQFNATQWCDGQAEKQPEYGGEAQGKQAAAASSVPQSLYEESHKCMYGATAQHTEEAAVHQLSFPITQALNPATRRTISKTSSTPQTSSSWIPPRSLVAPLGLPAAERDRLRALRITDLNTLPVDEVQAELARAGAQQRTLVEFRHRLASGELRDVEVHSGPVQLGSRRLLFSI